MRRRKILLAVLSGALAFSLVFSLLAQEKEENFQGNFRLGYRVVDTSGADFKYMEDINLKEGVRLFEFSLHYAPGEKFAKLFDRMDIHISNFGGDPFETLRLAIRKYGSYRFRYDRKKASYFYHDLHEAGSGLLYDQHTFAFDRIMDSGLFTIDLGKTANLYLNFDLSTKAGESTTTFDLNRVEYEFNKPVSEESRVVAVGVNVHFNGYSFVLEEKIEDYETSNSLFLPGYADGGPGARYPSSLNYYFLNQPYDFKVSTHTLKFNSRPFPGLLVAGSARLSDQDLNLSYSEDADGVDYLGFPFRYSLSGTGSFKRRVQLYELDVSCLLTNRLVAVGAVRYHDFEQDGSFTVDSSAESMALGFDTLGLEAGLQYQFSPRLALTLGLRHETRDLQDAETVTNETQSLRSAFFGNIKWDLRRVGSLTLDYQRGYYDGPYTLISPTLHDRLKATAKVRFKQFDFTGSCLLVKAENEIPSELWESSRTQLKLRLGYRAEKVKVSAGYALIDVEHRSERTIFYPPSWAGPGTFPWSIHYEGKSHLLDGSLSLSLAEKWTVGTYANFYTNRGFWEISRTQARAYVEYTLAGGLNAQLGYRFVDFEEKISGFNDYQANIVEISFGYRWK